MTSTLYGSSLVECYCTEWTWTKACSCDEEWGICKNWVGAFEGCTKLPSITLSSNCTAIGDTAFLNNTSLTTVSGTSGLTKIGTKAFYGDILLSSIDISNVTSIENWAF